ncbi:MAG TPA: prolipoprotein diacylglyceryl transferase family protein, partial [Chitinophagaceae bacterium]|nr:prolipoprotein diacylglyceryl transferase family protein [Chitinophagaceae bacterium]
FFIGFRYFLYLRKRQQDPVASRSRIWVIIGAIFGALIGSRLLGSLERPYELFMTDNLWLYIYANKTVVGGFLGGLIGVELAKKLIGEKKSSGDLFVYPMILALCIGRVGCFSMGVYEETYGTETSLPWGMDLGDGLSRHPVDLYEIIFLVFLWVIFKRTQQTYILNNGALFKLFMIAYLLFRFLLEFIKPHYTLSIGLSSIQLACSLGLLYYARFIVQPKKLLAAYA